MNTETSSEHPSPLHKAINDGDLATVQKLIAEGLDIHKVDDEGWTPLGLATSLRYLPLMQVLLDAGVDMDLLNDFGTAPIFHAASGPDQATESLQLLIEAGADIHNPNDNDGRSPLQQATIENLTAKVRLLLDAGADVHYEGIMMDARPSFTPAWQMVNLMRTLSGCCSIGVPIPSGPT